MARLSILLLCALAALPAPALEVAERPGVPLFRMPELAEAERAVAGLIRAGREPEARIGIEALIRRYPEVPAYRVERARMALRAGDRAVALADLEAAVALGFDGLAALAATPDLAPLAGDPGLARLLATPGPAAEAPPPPRPASVADGIAPVGRANTAWDPDRAALVPLFAFPAPRPGVPVRARLRRTGAGAPAEDPSWSDLNRRHARGEAAGLAGVLYDNRDDGHSALDVAAFPALARIRYLPEAEAAGVHYGLNTQFLFPAPTLGNSSTAIARGLLWRSLPRLALTTPGGADRLAMLYAANHLYVFPEHRDHDPVPAGGGRPRDGAGDLIPANVPYHVIAQGSSGSDRPVLEALLAGLAAWPPAVRARAEAEGLVAPTLQMLLRRGQLGVGDDAAYLSAAAHPTAFEAARIDRRAIVARAARLTPETLPPATRISVLTEGPPPGPADAALPPAGEALFDTAFAIARVWRGTAAERRYRLDASGTRDPNGRPLRFHWRLLRGDSGRVSIRPLDAAGAQAEVLIAWQDGGSVPGRPDMPSDRIDIAVIADNGAELAAPAFLSVLLPGHERRRFEDGPAGRRIAEIDHADPDLARRYRDPVLFPRADWRDRFVWGPDGALIGWIRSRGGRETRFTAEGFRVLETDAAGRPALAERVGYAVETDARRGPRLVERRLPERVRYRYAGPDDRRGQAEPLRDAPPVP